MNNSKNYIIGVTGYLGSGKSTALSFLEKHGFYCIDADKIVHDLYEPGNDGWVKVKDFFGEEFLTKRNGRVNRSKLRRVVFNNAYKLKILEKIIHPLVFNEIRKKIQKAPSKKIAIEAIRFDERRMGKYPDVIVWVETQHEESYKRIVWNEDISRKEYETIVSLQEKPKKIDFTIQNNGTLAALEDKIDKFVETVIPKIS